MCKSAAQNARNIKRIVTTATHGKPAIEGVSHMHPTPQELCDLLECILTNSPLGNPTRANLYKTHGYRPDTPFAPLRIVSRISRYYGNTLSVNITLSKRGHLMQWRKENPNVDDIVNALKCAQHAMPRSLVMLSKSPATYIKTDITCLEYQDASFRRHFHCPPEHLCSTAIKNAFLSYAQGCSWWKEQIPWR